MHYNLSPSTLGIMIDCPKCFWLHIKKKQKRPRGPFPSLPGGMDLILKKYFDQFRGSLPPEIIGQVQGVLFDNLILLNKWRYWKTSLKAARENVTVYGAFDDLLQDKDIYIPLDYKTRGSSPKENTDSYFIHQLDIYTLLLEDNGYKTNSLSYLVYYYPNKVEDKGKVNFDVEIKRVTTSLERAEELIQKAKTILEGSEPASSSSCEYCNWAREVNSKLPFQQLSF